MEEATILQWRVSPGAAVAKGDIVALIDTEKSEIELEIWDTGTIVDLVVTEGEVVRVGAPLARLSVTDASIPPAASLPRLAPRPTPPSMEPLPRERLGPGAATPSLRRPAHQPAVHSPLVRRLAENAHLALSDVVGTGPGDSITRADVERRARRVPASPLARRLAADRNLDLAAVAGSGPDSAVLATDLPPETAPEPGPTPSKATTMRIAIANLMTRSNREIPHYHLAQDIGLAAAMAWLETTNSEVGVARRILPAALLLRASALALAKHPELNGFWGNDGFQPGEGVQLGVAVSIRGRGLIAPAIIDADSLALPDLMAALRDLVNRARAGQLKGSEMSSATATVTNLGDRGPDLVHGVIHPPQVTLIGFGRITQRPVVVDGTIVAHPVVTATLAADHRATDGDRGARLLSTIDQLLQKPDRL